MKVGIKQNGCSLKGLNEAKQGAGTLDVSKIKKQIGQIHTMSQAHNMDIKAVVIEARAKHNSTSKTFILQDVKMGVTDFKKAFTRGIAEWIVEHDIDVAEIRKSFKTPLDVFEVVDARMLFEVKGGKHSLDLYKTNTIENARKFFTMLADGYI
jgi:hypothetical protein